MNAKNIHLSIASLLFGIFYLATQTIEAQTPSPASTVVITPAVPTYPLKTPTFDLTKFPTAFFAKELNEAKTMMQNGKFDVALTKINSYLKSPPARAPLQRAYLLKGICQQFLNKDSEAILAFNDSLKLQAAGSDTLYFRAQSLARTNKNSQALIDLEEALWFGKTTLISLADINLQMALIHRHLGDNKKAMEKINAALTQQANFAAALFEMGELNLTMGDKITAVRNLRAAALALPDNSEIELQLAKALLTQSDRVNGAKDINEALALTKKNFEKDGLDDSQREIAGALYLKAAIEAGQAEQAQKLLNQLIKENPKSLQLQRLREQLKIEKQSQPTATATSIAPL